MSTPRFYSVSTKGKLVPLPDLATVLLHRKQGGGYVWLDYTCPTREDLESLVEPLGLDPHSVEDCLDQDQIPKIEDFPTNTFLLVNRYCYEGDTLHVEELDCMIGKGFLVSVHQEGDLYDRFFELAATNHQDVGKGPDFLLHLLLDTVVDHKIETIDALQDLIEKTEEEILTHLDSFDPSHLMLLRRHLLALRKSLFHEREVLLRVSRRDSPFISEKAVFHFRDIYDHLARFFEAVEMDREMVGNLLEMYHSMVNTEMARVANRTNQVVRRLTFITTVFMPLTLLAGIGGMSEWSMMTGPENWRITYPLFLLLMAVLGVANYFVLRWIDAKGHDRPR